MKVILIVVGSVIVLLGIATGVMQLIAMFSKEGLSTYNSLYPNTLSGAAQQMSIFYTNFWLAAAGIISGLLFIAPVEIGRAFRIAGYTTPDAEVVTKAYRAGGIYMVIGGILALAARVFFSPVERDLRIVVLVLPLVFIILGVAGLAAGMIKTK